MLRPRLVTCWAMPSGCSPGQRLSMSTASTSHPRSGCRKPSSAKNKRQRVLTDTEMRALWQAAEKLGYPYGDLFRLLALTGQRKSEVAEAPWREFDLNKRLWTIPPERMKGDAAHEVPLTDDVMAILEALPRFNNGDLCSPRPSEPSRSTASARPRSISTRWLPNLAMR